MDDRNKNKDQLINELEQMRQQVAVLERAETENGRIREDLKKQNDELQYILDSVPAFIFYKDREGKLIRGNAAVARSADMPKEGWVGKTVFDLLPGLAESYYEDDMEVMASGKPKRNIIEPFDTPKGLRWLRTTKIPAKDPEGNVTGLIGFSVDITDRMQAEEALKESEEKLRAIFDSASDGIIVVDVEGRIVEVNQAALSMSGYTREGIIGRSSFEIIAEKDRAAALQLMADALREGVAVPKAEYTIIAADGKELVAEVGSAMLRDNLDNVLGFVVTGRDVTEHMRAEKELQSYRDHLEKMVEERTADLTVANKQLKQEIVNRKRAEVAMRDSEERLRATFESMGEGVLIVDLQGNIAEANRTALNMSKTRKKELIGRNIFEFIAPEERTQAMSELGAVLAAGVNRADLEYTFVDAEGKRIDAEFSATLLRDSAGNPAGIIGIARDITERKRMEKALKESEEKLRTMFESIGDAITLTDIKGRILDLNKAAVKTFGLNNKEEAIGQEGFKFLAAKSYDVAVKDVAELLEEGSLGSREYTMQTADGREFEAESTGAILRDASGNPMGFAIINRDITERKRMEKTLRESEEKLRFMFESMGDAIVVIDLNGKITEVNERLVAMSGYESREQVLGEMPLNSLLRGFAQGQWEISRTAERQVSATVEYVAEDRYGRKFDVEANGAVLRDAVGKSAGFIIALRDVSDRKRMEIALRESEARYRELYKHMTSGVIVYEAINGGEDFIGKDFNSAAERISKLRREDFIGKSFLQTKPGIKKSGLFYVMQEVWRTGEPQYIPESHYEDESVSGWRENFIYKLPSGEVVTVYNDITDRKRMEEALRESEMKFRTIFETIPDGVTVADLEGRIIDQNQAGVRLLGYNGKGEVIGLNAFNFIVEKERPGAVADMPEVLETGLGSIKQYRMRRKDGREFDVEFIAATMRGGFGSPTGLIVLTRDITERKRMEDALRVSEEKLRIVFDAISDGIAVTDLQINVVQANEAVTRMAGYSSKDELIGKNALEWVVPEDLSKTTEPLDEALKGRPIERTELRIRSVQGREFLGDVGISPLRDSSGNMSGFVTVIRDVTERRRAEEALRQSEEKYRSLVDHMQEGYLIVRGEHIKYANERCADFLGIPVDKIIGKSIWEFVVPADMEKAKQTGEVFTRGGGTPLQEFSYYREDGRLVPLEANLKAVSYEGKPALAVVLRDITERKQMEREIRESEEKLRTMFQTMRDGVVLIDTNGKIVDVNEAILRIGRHESKDKLIGRLGFDLVMDKDRDRLSKAVTASLSGGEAIGMWEAEFSRGDGTEFDAEMTAAMLRDSAGKPSGFIGVIRDVTERKKMEQALRDSETKLRFMFSSMIDAVVVVDLGGKIMEMNDAGLRMTGYSSREEVIGKNAFDFIVEEDRARAVGDLAKSLETAPGFMVQYKFVDKDGKKYDVEAAGSMLFDDDGNVTGFINVVRDITERKRMQEELKQSEEKLRAMFNSIGDAVTITDLKGTILDENQAAVRIAGLTSKDELIGRNGFELIAEKDRAKAMNDMLSAFKCQDTLAMEYTLLRNDGSQWEGEASLALMRDSKGKPMGVVSVTKDITERKRMQEELKQSEEKLRAIFESIGDGLVVVGIDGTIQDLNAEACRMLGCRDRAEVVGRRSWEFLALGDRDRSKGYSSRLFAEGRAGTMEFVLKDPDGKDIYVDSRASIIHDTSGKPVGLVGISRDVTERRRMEEALRESEEKLRFMFNSIADGVVSVDLQGNIRDANPAFVQMTGYGSKEEMLGCSALDLVAPSDSAKARGQFAKYERGLEQAGGLEYTVRGKSGREFSADVSAGRLCDAEGKPMGFIVAVRDVSERRRMQEELRESEEKLRTILDTSPDFIMSLDRDGRLLFINRTVPEMTVEQAIGTSAYDYILPEARDEYRETIERIFAAGEPAAIETSGLGPGGRTSYYETRFAPVRRNGEVTSVTLISTDITERKVAGEALRESEEKLRFMFESMGDAIVVVDVEGKIVEVNEKLIAMSGYQSREEVLGRNAFEFVAERDRTKAMEDFAQNMERQVSATIEYVSVDRYGREFDVEANGAMLKDAAGKPVGFIIALRDVSERKLMEQKLRDSEEMARGMLESAATGIYLVQDGKFEYVSPMFANISGYTNDELIGTQALGYVHPDDREMVRERAVESLKGKSGLPYEFRFVRKDGTIVWILEKVASIQYKGKRATIASFMDITEHRQADQALRESEEKLRGFMDSATDYFTIWDSKLNLLDLNEAALHYPVVDFAGKIQKENVIGKNMLKLEPTIRDTDRYDQYMEVIRTGKPFFAEDIIPHTKLGDVHMAISAFRVGEGLGIITTDVTERRRAEGELRESKSALEKRTNQLLALQKVTASIQSTLSLSDVLQQVAEGVVENLGYDQSMVIVVDEKADVYRARAYFSKDRPKYREGVESIMEQALADIQFPRKRGYSMGLDESMDGKVVIAPNFSALAVPPLNKQQANAIQKFLGANTVVSMPLFAMERHVGGILAFTAREDIAEPDIEPLRLLADQAGVAIVNANIYEGAAEMAQRLAVTGTLSRILGSSLDIREVYKAFVEEIHNVIDFERASIALVEGDRLRFLAVSPDVEPGGGTMMPVAGSPTEWVIQQKRTNIEHDLAVERQFSIDSVYAEEGMRSAIRVPLISKGEAFGSFNLVSRNPNAYGEREQGILEQVAGSVAAAIENSRLFIRIKEHEAELVKAYEELKKAQEYMVQAERLRALGELAGGVAHDFNNVLAIILGRAQLALEDVKDAKLKKDLQIIEQTALDAATTVRRLQDFARVRVDRGFENVDLNEVVEGALQMVESRRMELKETRGVIIDVDADLGEVPSVQGEAAELREALVNIIFNAIDAMPKGGSLTVKSRQDKEGVLLSIRDTGEGIPDDVKGKIFDPFFTTRPQKGSGLGLSVTYGIITRHGGRIEFESEVGKGTTFYIWLPMAIGVKTAKRPEQKAASVKSAEVLLVDDDPEVSEVLQRMLRQMGHRVKGVNSGEEAVNTFEAGHYDLVVTDLGMPDMSGREVAAAVKDIKPGTPVLLITGWGVQLDPSELPEIDGIVAKPFSKEVLKEQLAKLLPAEDGGSKEKPRKKKGPC